MNQGCLGLRALGWKTLRGFCNVLTCNTTPQSGELLEMSGKQVALEQYVKRSCRNHHAMVRIIMTISMIVTLSLPGD